MEKERFLRAICAVLLFPLNPYNGGVTALLQIADFDTLRLIMSTHAVVSWSLHAEMIG